MLYARRRTRPDGTPQHQRTGITLTDSHARERCSTTGALASTTIRPLQEVARVLGRSILLTTHFSGADKGRVEPNGSTMVAPVIVNQGEVVRPSQLIASVGRTRRREWAGR
jgi:hypothetical protein